jgi:hypothetical protein
MISALDSHVMKKFAPVGVVEKTRLWLRFKQAPISLVRPSWKYPNAKQVTCAYLFKKGQRRKQRRQRRGLLMFSDLSSLTSTKSPSE